MPVSLETSNNWMASKEIPEVRFFLNDRVRFTTEGGTTALGSVVSLLELTPEPMYLVETDYDGDTRVPQSALSSVNA